MSPSTTATAPLVDEEQDLWRRRVAQRDPVTLDRLKAGLAGISSGSQALTACFEQGAWDWIEQLWPPRPEELNQPAFVYEWVLDAMQTGHTQRALDLYRRTEVEKDVGQLLSLAVVRGDPALWKSLVDLEEWSNDHGHKAAAEFVRWGSQHRRHRTLARTWFLKLAGALPDTLDKAALVKVALDEGMVSWADALFKRLTGPLQRLAALECWPVLEKLAPPHFRSRAWAALETPADPGEIKVPPSILTAWMDQWFTGASAEACQRLVPCLNEAEGYAAWHAAHAAGQEPVATRVWERLKDREPKTLRSNALFSALEMGDLAWTERWWSPSLGAAMHGEEHFQMAILSHSGQDPAILSWTTDHLDWCKLDRCVRGRGGQMEDFEVDTLDAMLLRAPSDICQDWVHRHHGQTLALPLASTRTQALARHAQATASAPPVRAFSRPRKRS